MPKLTSKYVTSIIPGHKDIFGPDFSLKNVSDFLPTGRIYLRFLRWGPNRRQDAFIA